MEKESFILYQEQKETFEILSNEEAGILIKAIFEYEKTGIMPDIDKTLKIAFLPIKNALDRNKEKYQKVVERNKNNIKKRWEKENTKNTTGKNGKEENTKNTDNDNEHDNDNVIKKENKQRKKFMKPTVEQIMNYCNQRNNNVDAQRFYDFYESKGWKVGKESMKDWQACIRTWERSSTPKDNVKRLRSDKPPGFYDEFYDVK